MNLQIINNRKDIKVDIDDLIFKDIFDKISNSDVYKGDFFSFSFQHNIYHIQRVMLFSQIIAQNESVGKHDLKLLLLAAALHDSGRIKDRKDYNHGKKSAELAKKYIKTNIKNISDEDINIIQIIIEYHVITEKENGKLNITELKKICENYKVYRQNYESIKILCSILKDADSLDRARFGKKNDLKISLLRTNTARNSYLIDYSRKLNQEFARIILNSNYKYDDLIENDFIKTLSFARKRFFEESKGGLKKEKTIPIRIIKKLFNNALLIKTNSEIQYKNTYRNFGTLYIGGTGEMNLCKDEYGKDYIFKPSYRKNTREYQLYREKAQVIASILQEKISPNTAVKCEHYECDGISGTIQPKIEIDEVKTKSIADYYLENNKIDENIIRQFMREYVVDFCLCNYDATFRNFIVDFNGNLRGVDKEQSFKYIKSVTKEKEIDYFMQNNLNENYGAKPPIYGKIFEDIINGKINIYVLDELKDAIKELNAISDNEYIEIIKPYVNSLNVDLMQRKIICSNILLRKKYINNILEKIKNRISDREKQDSYSELEM